MQEIGYTAEEHITYKNTFTYDERGDLTVQLSYGESGILAETVSFQRDQEGRVLERRQQYEDGSQTLMQHLYEPQKEEILQWNEVDKFEGKTIRKYDKSGKITEETRFNAEMKQLDRDEYFYDKDEQLVEHREFGKEGDLLSYHHYVYDDKRRLIQKQAFTAKGELVDTYKIYYDQKGQIEAAWVNGITTRYTYDQRGMCIKEEVQGDNGSLEATRVNFYDAEGLLISTSSYEAGERYEIEPQVVTRTQPVHTQTKMSYEFFEE